MSDPVLLDLSVKEQACRLSEFGLSLRYVETLAEDDLEVERGLRRQLLGEELGTLPTPTASDAARVVARTGLKTLPYIRTILECGHFLTICPATGRPLKSNGTFAIDGHHIAYRFSGAIVFYLIVGRFHGRRSALCFPSLNLLVTLNVPERGLSISRWVASSMKRLINFSIAEPDKYGSRMTSTVDGLTLVVGGMPNFGHHIWQEMSGISELISGGYQTKVQRLLVGPHTWFNWQVVFPELAHLPVMKCKTVQEMLLAECHGSTLIRPIGLKITAELRARLLRAAIASLDPDTVRKIRSAGDRSRLVWINLRSHNKRWVTQIEGYAALLNTLQDEFGDIGVVYDGLVDTAVMRDEIENRLHGGIVRYDTLGASIETSLLWADAVSVYVSVVGSGLALNSWLTLKPGIAHANCAHLNQRSFWNSASDGMIPTNFIQNKDVTDDGTLYGDYNFDWKSLLPELRLALKGINPHPSAHLPVVCE